MNSNDKVLTINDVWAEIGKIMFLEPSTTKKPLNFVIETKQKEDGVDLVFWYESEEAAHYIMKMKPQIMKRLGVWFDSGFGMQEAYIEWNLDHFSVTEPSALL